MADSSWYQHTPEAASLPPAVAERALEWLVELQTPTPPAATLAAWQAWRAAHPDHERAWQRIESVRGRLQVLASPVSAAIAQATLTPRHSPRRRHAIKTLAVLVFGGGAAWGMIRSQQWSAWNADLRTATGQRRTLVLEDGTQLAINSGSALDLVFDAHQRRIRLIAGELLASTGKAGGGRPFMVETAEGVAHALGTRYRVRQLTGQTEVSVYEGAVRLVPRNPFAEALVLQAGQQARFSADAVGVVTAADQTATAWAGGFIVAHGMRLQDFLDELGRYTTDTLSCDPAAAGLRVSGSFPLADTGAVLDSVALTLGLDVQRRQRIWGARHVRLVLAPAA